MGFTKFVSIPLVLCFAISLAAHKPDFQDMLDLFETKLNENWNKKLRIMDEQWRKQLKIRDQTISELKLEMQNVLSQCHCSNDSVINELDIQDDIDELRVKVADLENEDKELHMEINDNVLDIVVIQDDIYNLDTITNELGANHSRDHNMLIGLVQENKDSIADNFGNDTTCLVF